MPGAVVPSAPSPFCTLLQQKQNVTKSDETLKVVERHGYLFPEGLHKISHNKYIGLFLQAVCLKFKIAAFFY